MATKDLRIEMALSRAEVDKAQVVFVDDLPMGEIDRESSLKNQVRHAQNGQGEPALIEGLVSSYQIHLARGDVFPPIVLLGKTTLDGNNRVEAARLLQWKSWPHGAYILAGLTAPQIESIKATFNVVMNGGRATDDVRKASALRLVRDSGMTRKAAAIAVGLPEDVVVRYVFDADTLSKAEGTGIADATRLSAAVRADLNPLEMLCYKKGVALAVKYKLRTDQVHDMVAKAKGAASEAKAIEAMTKVVTAMKPPVGYAREPKEWTRFCRATKAVLDLTLTDMAVIPTSFESKVMDRIKETQEWLAQCGRKIGRR